MNNFYKTRYPQTGGIIIGKGGYCVLNTDILKENEKKRISLSLPLLFCFSVFTVWQMGVVFFSSKSLSLDGKTPLPVTQDNSTAVIAVAYLVSILALIFLQKYSVVILRGTLTVSLVSMLLFYLPFSPEVIALFFYLQTFCCVFLIGFIGAVIINLFTLETELIDVAITSAVSGIAIALLQNDIFSVSYPIFHVVSIIANLLVLFSTFKFPKKIDVTYATKKSSLPKPKLFAAGVFLFVALTCLMTLFGSTVAEGVKHGVSIYNLNCAVGGVLIFVLWKKLSINPARIAVVLLGIGAVGFILAFVATIFPSLSLLACALIGLGYCVSLMSSFFGIMIFMRYPSKYIVPTIIVIALLTVLVHTALLDALRTNLSVLYIIYTAIALTVAVVFFILCPYTIFSLREKKERSNQSDERASDAFEILSGQEWRIANYILSGYSGGKIAEMMSITNDTMKSYRKTMYSKLQIHSKRELFELAEKGK